MKSFSDWWIVSSVSGKTKDGFPCGEYLCKSNESALEMSDNVEDPVIRKYLIEENLPKNIKN